MFSWQTFQEPLIQLETAIYQIHVIIIFHIKCQNTGIYEYFFKLCNHSALSIISLSPPGSSLLASCRFVTYCKFFWHPQTILAERNHVILLLLQSLLLLLLPLLLQLLCLSYSSWPADPLDRAQQCVTSVATKQTHLNWKEIKCYRVNSVGEFFLLQFFFSDILSLNSLIL